MNNSFNFNQIWHRITTSSRTREREARAQREAAQRERTLREEFARRTHALESQIAQAHAENCRLRAENRALLNSVLGIAGIPPVIVADPPDLPFVGAQHAVPGADACLDAAHTPALSSADARQDGAHRATAPPSHGRHSERSEEPLFVSPGCLDAKSKRGPSSLMKPAPQDDGAVEETVTSNGAASPSPPRRTGHSSAVPLPNQTLGASTPPGTNTAVSQKRVHSARPGNAAPAIAPIRRRSWHQIYRMLEFESSRRKEREP